MLCFCYNEIVDSWPGRRWSILVVAPQRTRIKTRGGERPGGEEVLRGRQSKTLTEYQNAPAASYMDSVELSWLFFKSHFTVILESVTVVETLAICGFIIGYNI